MRDGASQPDRSYVHYLGDESGLPVSNCLSTMDAQFEHGGTVYHVSGTIVRDFADVRTLSIGSNDVSFISGGSWTSEGMPAVTASASFWPFEQGPNGTIMRQIYPTDSGR